MWHKGKLWERATHVPLTLLVPDVTVPGTASAQPVSLLDLYPTFVDLARLKAPDHLDGQSLVSLIKEPSSSRDRPAITAMGGGKNASYSARSERYRYIRYADGSEELYDENADPNEWTNIASAPEQSATKAQLAAALPTTWNDAFRPASETAFPEAPNKSICYRFQAGDTLPPEESPAIQGRGFDLEITLDYRSAVDQDSTLISQGGAQNGWILHMLAGKPTLTFFIDGKRESHSLMTLADGKASLRVQVGGNGLFSMAVFGQGELYDKTPFPAGFPAQPNEGLKVAQSFGPLSNKDFPNSTPYDGTIHSLWMTLLPPPTPAQ